METVSVMFYWGGNTLQDPEEGFSYDIPPKGFYEVTPPMSLVELGSMLMPKVVSSGETGRLRFTCRFPFRNWQNVLKYKPFPINDDESFSTLLQNCSIFPSCPEIYVVMENTYREEHMRFSPIPLAGFNAPGKMPKQSKRFLTSTSPEKHSPAAEIVESNVNLLTKILLLVPAKSLMKFKCVSKHWLSLISDSQFGSDHTRSNPTPLVSGIYLYSGHWVSKDLSLNELLLPVSIGSHLRSSLPTFSFLEGVMSKYLQIASHSQSSNGLILLCRYAYDSYDEDKSYIVCNLTTQKFVALPKHSHPSLQSCCGEESYLVFDPTKSLYYKVVLVNNSNDRIVCQLCIYSSESASWKNVSMTPPIKNYGHGTIWNGAIIWRNWSSHEHVYYRLDVDTERLTVTHLPPDPNLSKGLLYFGECDGHLLLIQLSSHDAEEFMVLEMDKDDFHWTVKYRVDLTSLILPNLRGCVVSVIGVVKGAKENDMAVVFYNRGKVYYCNLECRTMKVLCDLPPDQIPNAREEDLYEFSYLYEYSYQFIESLSPV